MPAADAKPDPTPTAEESDLTTTAEVLTARQILEELGEDTTMIHHVDPPPRRMSWWQRLRGWLGLKT